MISGFHMIGVTELQRAFVKVGAEVDAATLATVQQATKMFLTDSKNGFEGSHKRGEPHSGGDKPNIVTGNLRRSILAEPIRHHGMGEYSTNVGPSMVYGRRVELGFQGPDSLGRVYHQPPYPYMGPAYDRLHDNLPGIMAANWKSHVL